MQFVVAAIGAQAHGGHAAQTLAGVGQQHVRALLQARAAGVLVTDEAAAIERLGLKPLLVAGAADNIKITFPDDLALAEALLQAQLRAGVTT